MCGIVGVAHLHPSEKTSYNHFAEDYCKVFTSMLLEAQCLGRDATGIFTAKCAFQDSQKGTIRVLKEPGPASNFVKLAKYQRSVYTTGSNDFSSTEGLYLVGHCRGATLGTPKDNSNNHPFVCGDIVGVHNGIISNYREIRKDYPEALVDGACDSEIIFSLMHMLYCQEDVLEIEQAICQTASMLDGWYACVGADKDNYPTLFFFRDSTGPMEFIYEKTNKVLMFASSFDFIEKALNDNKIKGDFEEKTLGDNEGLILDTLGNDTFEKAKRFSLVDGSIITDIGASKIVDRPVHSVEREPAVEESGVGEGGFEVEDWGGVGGMVQSNLGRIGDSETAPSVINPSGSVAQSENSAEYNED